METDEERGEGRGRKRKRDTDGGLRVNIGFRVIRVTGSQNKIKEYNFVMERETRERREGGGKKGDERKEDPQKGR